MSGELYTDDGAVPPHGYLESGDDGRPNLSGDLPTVFSAGPMFRRTAVGYDRFEVDTYVQWAEDELATAEREREHLLTRQVETRAALEDARELLSHSSAGAEVLRMSGRIGSLLAAAADEAAAIRAEADAERSAASETAQRTVAEAERLLAESEAEARRMVADAMIATEQATVEAGQIVEAAEQTRSEARIETAARLAEIAALELRAAHEVERLRQLAVEDGVTAQRHARQEIVAMLAAGREERRRADDAAAALRERLDEDARTRRTVVLAEVSALEVRRTALEAELELLAGSIPAAAGRRFRPDLRGLGDRLRVRIHSPRLP
jgi:hypothetical protein